MELQLLDNRSQTLGEAISSALAESEDSRMAVAFVSAQGLGLLEPALQQCLKRKGSVEFLVGLDLSFTDPQALRTLYQWSRDYAHVACYCLTELGPSVVYHPKLYVFRAGEEVRFIVGSSNLTEGGLRQNMEVNALVRAHASEEIVSDIYAVYNALKFHPKRVEPDEEFVSLYEELFSMRKRERHRATRKAHLRRVTSRFREKVSTLRRPVPTPKDLDGWQRLVFMKLPEERFKTRDLYQFEEEFRSHYPQNRNIRAKVRQVLQQLRDLGLVKHVEWETWEKHRA